VSKYEIELRYRAIVSESIECCHNRFMAGLEKIPVPWGLKEADVQIQLPDIGDDLLSVCDLSSALGNGIKGHSVYVLRSADYLQDKAQYDDNVAIKFDPKKINFNYLVEEIFPLYIKAFLPYRATIQSSDIANADWPEIADKCNSTEKDVNGRDGVYRINAVNYYDRELCQRAFDLSPEQIIERLDGKVESVSLLLDGVMLIYSSKLLERDELEKIDAEVKALLV